jgi:ABC-type multidrug transport system fused ATPase/permease subunit
MLKAFPDTGETEAPKILKYMMTYWVIISVAASVLYLFLNFLGKKLFGILSFNLTYDIRKLCYVNILTKNIGFFDHAENSTPVLSGVL